MKDSQKGTRIGKEAGQADPAGSFPGWLWRLASNSGKDGEERQAASMAGITLGRANGEERTKQLYIIRYSNIFICKNMFSK